MKKIQLTQGKIALVDDCDFEELSKYNWCVSERYNTSYAKRGFGKPHRTLLMHRVIMNAKKGQEIDHRDGNGLNNQKENLRFCNHSENLYNQSLQKGKSSQFKGVYWQKENKNWVSRLKINGRNISLGSFENEISAAKAYDYAAIKHFGEYSRPNFPQGEATDAT